MCWEKEFSYYILLRCKVFRLFIGRIIKKYLQQLRTCLQFSWIWRIQHAYQPQQSQAFDSQDIEILIVSPVDPLHFLSYAYDSSRTIWRSWVCIIPAEYQPMHPKTLYYHRHVCMLRRVGEEYLLAVFNCLIYYSFYLLKKNGVIYRLPYSPFHLPLRFYFGIYIYLYVDLCAVENFINSLLSIRLNSNWPKALFLDDSLYFFTFYIHVLLSFRSLYLLFNFTKGKKIFFFFRFFLFIEYNDNLLFFYSSQFNNVPRAFVIIKRKGI